MTRGLFVWVEKPRGPPCQARAAELRTTDRRDDLQSEDTWMELHVLHRHGWSIAALAREFGLDWRTATPVRDRTTEPPRYRPRARPAELSAAQPRPRRAAPGRLPRPAGDGPPPRARRRYGYTGSYTSLRRRVVELRPRQTAEPELRFETGPGIQTQGDWTDCGVWPLGDGDVRALRLRGHPRLLSRMLGRPLRDRQDPSHDPRARSSAASTTWVARRPSS